MSNFKHFTTLLLVLFSMYSLHAQFKGSHKISSKLFESLDRRTNDKIFVHVMLEDQVDLDAWEKYFTLTRMPYPERAKALIKALKNKAANTQEPLYTFLQSHPSVEKDYLKKHWIANAISFFGTSDVVRQLAARDDVKWIGENVVLAQTSYETIEMSAPAPDDIENGLRAINAPAMWALGYTGYGTKVFTADTGVDPTHPSIRHQYHGNYFPESQSWYPNPFAPNQAGRGPFDCSNHGTHVTGTVLGLDRETNDTIGVAFNATWIGGAILCGVGTADNIGAFEWAVDPDGDENTTDDMPDAINNSWYDPSLNELDCYSVYVPILHTLELVGVAVVFSAGNEGPDPATITQPHNININEVNTFTVGALNGNTPALPIASFSSRGPSHCEGEGSLKIKPEVSAPGVQVRSCVPGNKFALLNGTSMAAPHVSGAILLLKEAFPFLGAKELKTALYQSCTDLGAEGEDNVFGMGIINVFAAYEYLISQGHVPVEPRKANDAILLEVKHAVMGCNEQISPFILVENAGTDTISSLEIVYGIDANQFQFRWDGVLIPQQRTYLSLPPVAPGKGFLNLAVEVAKINGFNDEKPLNNKKSLSLTVTERESPQVEFLWQNNLCSQADFVLTSPFGGTGSHETRWYPEPFGGSPLYEGNVLVLPTDSVGNILYAEVTYRDVTGIPEVDRSKAYFEGEKNTGLLFDAYADITLTSFDILSERRHDTEFVILNEKGDVIHSTTRPGIPEGHRTITVNWKIPQGKNYQLIKKRGRGLLAQNQDVAFPYEIPNIVSFTSGVIDNVLSDDYQGFYNLKISYIEPCGRQPYIINVREDSVLVKAEFYISKDTLRLPDFNEISGQSLVAGIASIQWDMGDGTVYIEPDITHAYTSPGMYKVCFHVVDTNQCFTAAVRDIVVLESSSSNDQSDKSILTDIRLYPNPANHSVILEMDAKDICFACPVIFYDRQGIVKDRYQWNQNKQLEVDIQSWSTGIYIAQVILPDGVYSLKFVKI